MRHALTARDAMIPVRPINEPRSGTSGSGNSRVLRECTFGRTPCLVEVTRERVGGGPLWLATLYVREQDGRARRHVGDRAGLRVRIPAGDERTAVTNGTRYLEKRFGPLSMTPEPRADDAPVRPINEPPLKDERPTS